MPKRVVVFQALRVAADLDTGVDGLDGRSGAFGLCHANSFGGMDHLALQVRKLDPVVVDNAQGADTSGRQIHQKRCPKSAGADDENPRFEQPDLPLAADFGHD